MKYLSVRSQNLETSSNSFGVPVVLFIFNRLESTRQLISALEPVRPSNIYVVADGPRSESEEGICNATRELFENLPWPCKVHKNFSPTNLGLLRRLTSGIDWVFESEDKAIFLEDDCIPNSSFFYYTEQCLSRYENDYQIGMISGNNFNIFNLGMTESYTFSNLPRIWGWATWKTRWAKNQNSLEEWKVNPNSPSLLKERFPSLSQRNHWKEILSSKTAQENWDYQWVTRHFTEGWLSIVPKVNLVRNIGSGEHATHTKVEDAFMNYPTYELDFPLLHPRETDVNRLWNASELWSLRLLIWLGEFSQAIRLLRWLLSLGKSDA